ncbi:hypothetical protein Tco_0360560 [Tanacetum coccineum]
MAVNHLYQPWRAILSMINQCLTSKTSRHDRPRYPVLQMLWGRTHNIHQRSTSPFHLAKEDLRLSNLKFIPKGKDDEVFGMPIPTSDLNNIRERSLYKASSRTWKWLQSMIQKVAAKKKGKKKTASAKQLKPKPAKEKSSKPGPALKPKVTKEKPSKPSTAKPPKPKPSKEKSTKATPLQKADIATKEASTGPSAQPRDDTSVNIIHDSPSPTDAETCVESDKTNSEGDTEILQIGEEQGEDVDN